MATRRIGVCTDRAAPRGRQVLRVWRFSRLAADVLVCCSRNRDVQVDVTRLRLVADEGGAEDRGRDRPAHSECQAHHRLGVAAVHILESIAIMPQGRLLTSDASALRALPEEGVHAERRGALCAREL